MMNPQVAEPPEDFDLGELERLAGPALMAEPAHGWPEPDEQEQRRFRLVSVSELLQEPEPLSWLVRGYLLPRTQSLLFGDPATGKSLIALDWAACVALGRDWCGLRTHQGGVVYLAGEGHHGIRRRLLAWALDRGCLEALQSAPLCVSETGSDIVTPERFGTVVAAIREASEQLGGVALIVIDTLHRNIGAADENSSSDMAAFVQACDHLIHQFGCAVLTVHHSGHMDKNRARGSSAIRAAVDSEFCLSQRDEIRILACTKMKDAQPPAQKFFDLSAVTLPWRDDEGEPESSVVLHPTAQGLEPRRSHKLSAGQRLAFETLMETISRRGIAPPDQVAERLPDGARVAGLESWREEFYSRHTGDSQEAKKKAFQRARVDLVGANAVATLSDIYWPTDDCGGFSELQGLRLPRGQQYAA